MLRTSAALLLCALACGRARVQAVDGAPDATVGAGLPDAAVPSADGGAQASPDAGPVTYQIARVALHVHSAISHDACDHHGTNGGPLVSLDQDCLDQLEAALCSQRIDIAFLTDHPRYMDSKPIEDDVLLRGRGEQPLRDASGAVIGAQLPCGTQMAPGWEGTHTMPLGLTRQLTDAESNAYGTHTDNTETLADMQAALATVHAAGGIYFTAHSEEPDLPETVLEQLQTDGMEWYNIHGNFIALLGGQGDLLTGPSPLAVITAIKDLEPFLLGGHAAADLAYLPLLKVHFPEVGLQKWTQVLGARFIAAGLGNDVHRNVSVAPLCKGAVLMALCQAASTLYPNVLTALAAGGQLLLSDGERLDSYARVLRWLNNRALVTSMDIAAAREAMGRGRSYGVFAVLGEPGPVSFQARAADGTLLQMGDSAPAAGATLLLRLPDPPAPDLGPQWTAQDAARAQLHAVLWRGGEQVAAFDTWSAAVEFPVDQPGRYWLEVRVVPRHLDALAGGSDLTSAEYRWVLMNPIDLK